MCPEPVILNKSDDLFKMAGAVCIILTNCNLVFTQSLSAVTS